MFYKPNHLIFNAKYTLDSKMSEYSRKNASRVFGSVGLLFYLIFLMEMRFEGEKREREKWKK